MKNARCEFDFIGDRIKKQSNIRGSKTRCFFKNTQQQMMSNTRCPYDYISLGKKFILREGQFIDETQLIFQS